MDTQTTLSILEGTLGNFEDALAKARSEAESLEGAIDFTQTLIDIVQEQVAQQSKV